jgi:hypothetical protein
MELQFLGQKYRRSHQEAISIPGEVGGKFRGSAWYSSKATLTRTPKKLVSLSFRGVPYHTEI